MAVVPPYILNALSRHASGRVRTAAERTRSTVVPFGGGGARRAKAGTHLRQRIVYDGCRRTELPGVLVRTEHLPCAGDADVDRAFDMAGRTLEFYAKALDRDSIDDRGMSIVSTVHFGQRYQNAFWNRAQMVYGDGDGEAFLSFTSCLEIAAHELAHGVTQIDAGLAYEGESGALSESISDVFGSLVKQHALRQSAAEADWVIGAGIFGPDISGVGLRSLAAPGSAYDDPLLGGRDPQPSHMRGYVRDAPNDELVHTNSGIPNHAFYLFAKMLGGYAWSIRRTRLVRCAAVRSRSQMWVPHLLGRDDERRTAARLARRRRVAPVMARRRHQHRLSETLFRAAGAADHDAVVLWNRDRVERMDKVVHRRANLFA
jgi:Zn-dependent metalloprotease